MKQTIINTLGFLLLIIFFALLFTLKVYGPKIRGYLGEIKVASLLKKLDPSYYTIFNNVTLNNNGLIAQIDHVIVSNFGIFVIETKNYTGWIYGSEKSMSWTQSIYKNKYKFYNPVRQNQGHILALKDILRDLGYFNYISIITFSRRALLKTNTFTEIVYFDELVRTIENYPYKSITNREKVKIISRINSKNLSPKRRGKEISFDQATSTLDKVKQYTPKCPKCGGELINRFGKFGRFQGCEKYPKCRFTRNY